MRFMIVALAFIATAAHAQSLPGAPVQHAGIGASAGPCSSTVKGLVPATGGGTSTFLRADCTFAAPSGGVTGTFASGNVTLGNVANTSLVDLGQYTSSNHSTAGMDMFWGVDGSGTVPSTSGQFLRLNYYNDQTAGVIVAAANHASERCGFYGPTGTVIAGIGGGGINCTGGDNTVISSSAGLLRLGSNGIGRFDLDTASGAFLPVIDNTYAIGVAGRAPSTVVSYNFNAVESTAPSPAAGRDIEYGDATAHARELSNNGDAFSPVARDLTAFTTANVTNVTNTPADVTGLSVTLAIGAWDCTSVAVAQDSTGTEGLQYSLTFAGTQTTGTGVATLTSDAGVVTSASTQAGSSVVADAATFGPGSVHAHFMFVVTVAGVLKAQFAQHTHAAGTATVYKGASLVCMRM